MSTTHDVRRARASRRGAWPIQRHRLGEEPGEDLSATTTVEARLAMMWPLAREAYLLAGVMPDYARADAPGRVLRPGAPRP